MKNQIKASASITRQVMKDVRRYNKNQEVNIQTAELGCVQFVVSSKTRATPKDCFIAITPLDNVTVSKSDYRLFIGHYSDGMRVLSFKLKSTNHVELALSILSIAVVN